MQFPESKRLEALRSNTEGWNIQAGTLPPTSKAPREGERRRRSAPVFAALGDTTRLALIARLGDGQSHSIAQLTAGLDLTAGGDEAPAGPHRRRHGLLPPPRARAVVQDQPEAITEARDYLARASAQWDEAIERLRAVVEE